MSCNVQINGANGPYDNKKSIDSSEKYGRNAVENHINYMELPIRNNTPNPAPILDFTSKPEAFDNNIEKLNNFIDKNDKYLNSLPPLQYEYRYMPNIVNGQINKKALLGAAYEEMGGVKELTVKEFERRYMNSDMTAEPLDINKDGKIDNSEYATNILLTDMLSKENPDFSKIDGTITPKGMNAVLAYSKISNTKAATDMYAKLYNKYNLGKTNNVINS